ncbi:MAG: hypothetical protein AAF442_09580 [Pseudomonadota bacterium]
MSRTARAHQTHRAHRAHRDRHTPTPRFISKAAAPILVLGILGAVIGVALHNLLSIPAIYLTLIIGVIVGGACPFILKNRS